MNGATAEPWVKTTSRPSRASIRRIGPSHHFLPPRMKPHSSPRMPLFSRDPSKAIDDSTWVRPIGLVQLEQGTPVHVLAQRGLLLLVEEMMAEHEVVHVRAPEAEIGVVGR